MFDLDLTEFLESYLPDKFPDYKISGNNFMTFCPFCEHHKRKLGVNLNSGIFHCFICGEQGDFINLYSTIEGVTYFQANINLTYKTFLKGKPQSQGYKQLLQSYTVLEEFDRFVPVQLDSHSSQDELIQLAWMFLYKRKLFDLNNQDKNNFYVAHEGTFHDRLILPYTYKGTHLYFQGRSLRPGISPKYLNPGSNHGIRSADILYPFELEQEYVVVCEGGVDALSLQIQGVNATCTTGCYMSDTQGQALRQWGKKIILGYDNDAPGRHGIVNVENLRKKKMMPPIYICHPPNGFNDWNEAHEKDVDLKTWITENTYENNFDNQILKNLI